MSAVHRHTNVFKNIRTTDIPLVNIEITGNYDHDTNILKLHVYVLRYMDERKAKVPELQEACDRLIQYVKTTHLTSVVRHKFLSEKDKLQEMIDEYSSMEDRNAYNYEVKDILKQYKKIHEEYTTEIIFGEELKPSDEMFRLIELYITIASRYSPISLTKLEERISENICIGCMSRNVRVSGSGCECKNCGLVVNDISDDVSFGSLSHIGGTSRNGGYLNRENFIKTMLNYQGTQQDANFPEEIFTDIKLYCKKNQINIKILTPPAMRTIFKINGYPKYYEHINQFLRKFIGRACPDISQYSDSLLGDYDAFTQVYERIKENRSSAINSQYLLMKLIQRRGISYDSDNFKIPDTETIVMNNDTTTRLVFRELSWKFQASI